MEWDRETNQVAHVLARYALDVNGFVIWIEERHSWLIPLLQQDVMNFFEKWKLLVFKRKMKI